MSISNRSHKTFSLEQAVGAAPTLVSLQARIRASSDCLEQVRHLIPIALRTHVTAGPLDDGEWCLLVSNATVSTKLRQLLPAIQKQLAQNGSQISAIRLKIQTRNR